MRIVIEREVEKQQKRQKKKEEKRVNQKKVIQERKYFSCRGFGYIARNYRTKKENEDEIQQSSNIFEVLARRKMNVEVLRVEKQER